MNYAGLINAIKSATTQLQGRATAAANYSLVLRNWMVWVWIVEFEQTGQDRAKYGARLLETMAHDLAKRQVKGLGDPRALRDCRAFYQTYPQIRGTLSNDHKMICVCRIN